MSAFRIAPIGLLLAAIGLSTIPALFHVSYAANQDQAVTLRPEIGKPMQAAQELAKAKKYKEALAKIHEADAIGGKTPAESFTIERMRAAVAAAAGDNPTAIKSFEAVIESGRLPPSEQLKFIQAIASLYYQAKDYPKTITWLSRYLKEGGDDPKMHALLVQSYYLNGDFSHAAKEAQTAIQADEKSGRTPAEEQLQLLANCAAKQNDKASYTYAMEKLVTYHPKKEYWSDLLNRIHAKPGFADRLSLDVYRLKFAAGQLSTAQDYMEMSQLALQAGYPAEAAKIVEQGFKSGALGTGPDAERHKRLRNLALKNANEDQKTMAQGEADAAKNKDGTGLVNLGYAYVTTGQFDKGIPLMEEGLRKGVKRMDDARLHVAIAYMQAGQKTNAMHMFKSVQGGDGTADLARYWILQMNHPSA